MGGDDATAVTVIEGHGGPNTKSATWSYESAEFGGIRRLGEEIENFGLPAAPRVSQKPGGQHTTPVDHEQVASVEKIRKVGEDSVTEVAGFAVQAEKA